MDDSDNLQRMIQMAEEIFDMKNDSRQLQVNEEIIEKLLSLHPSSVKEIDYGKGPVLWLLLIPTQTKVMDEFVSGKIDEADILTFTKKEEPFTAVYLCSVMVLPEYRMKGLAFNSTIEAILEMSKTNLLTNLFVWPFSDEGKALAESIARHLNFNLRIKH